jgi:hypothetical protein
LPPPLLPDLTEERALLPGCRRLHLHQAIERGRERWRERERARERGRAERGDKTEGERGCACEEITGGGGLISSWVVGPADYHRLILSSLHHLGSIFRCQFLKTARIVYYRCQFI